MRLIDADALIDFIDPGHSRHPGELTFSKLDVVNMLNHALTAYDTDRVISELTKLRRIELNRPESCDEQGFGDGEQIYDDGISQGRFEAFNEAIEIVKGGGTSE